jgi:DNA-directed RNA polymerase specialized sigma24 family protein
MANIARNLSIDRIGSGNYRNHIKNQKVENLLNEVDDQFHLDHNILYLIYFKGYTLMKVAEMLGIEIAELKTRTREAVLMMRQ